VAEPVERGVSNLELLLFGVIAIAAGVRLSLEHVTDALALGPALLLAGGVALYLAGDVVFRRVMRVGPATYRAVAAILSLGAFVLGIAVSAAAALATLVAIVIATLVIEGAQSKGARLEVHA
jgi:low temperature requirement protein LtrA